MTVHSRNSAARKGRKSTPAAAVTADPTIIATAADAAVAGPRFSLVWGTRGRPEATRAETIAAAYDLLATAVRTIPAPKPPTIPRNVSPRVAAAIRADHAATVAAYDLLRAAVANGRRASK